MQTHTDTHTLKDTVPPCNIDLCQEKTHSMKAQLQTHRKTLLQVRGDIQSSVQICDEQCVLLVLWELAQIINLVS